MKNIIFSIFIAIPMLVSCAGINIVKEKPLCGEKDWYEIGRSDGTRGTENIKWQDHEKSCERFTEQNHAQYINGWYAGSTEFCKPENGYTFGKNGNPYYAVCPKKVEEEFMAAYQEGMKVFLFEKANTELNKQIRDLQAKAEEQEEPNRKSSIEGRIQVLQEKRQENLKRISKIESQSASKTL